MMAFADKVFNFSTHANLISSIVLANNHGMKIDATRMLPNKRQHVEISSSSKRMQKPIASKNEALPLLTN